MDRLGKLFIKASLIYLGLGAFFGVHMAFADHGYAQIRFVHVHFMLIGFMAMMIFGVGYHILPRFNARPLPYPGLVSVHFWLANLGLVGMGGLYVAGAFFAGGAPRMLFGVFGLAEATGMAIFIVNIFSVLMEEKAKPEPFTVAAAAAQGSAPETPAKPPVKLSPSMKIAEILEKYPHLEEPMAEEGLGDVVNPAARSTAATIVTLAMAAKKAGKDLGPLMARLEGKKLISSTDKPAAQPIDGGVKGKIIKRGEMATLDTLVGYMLEAYPETKSVLEAHYGAACFTCAGQKTETIEQTASIHGTQPGKILDEINAIIQSVK
ncbi:MAG: DUF1858 domain-containing protein [Nitrospinota bacterium]|nr:DUF1858 domain-containing protein [Nitrospinota bacterium]